MAGAEVDRHEKLIPCHRVRCPAPPEEFPSRWFLAQANHALTGLMIFPFLLFAHCPAWQPTLGILIFVTLKEFIADTGILQPLVDALAARGIPRWLIFWLALEHNSWNDEWQDFLAYLIGTMSCWLATHCFALGAGVFTALLLALAGWDYASHHSNQNEG